MTLGTRACAVAAGILAATLAVTPTQAAQAAYHDPADATASLTDIRTVEVGHSTTRVRVVVGFTDLRRRSTAGPAGLVIALDTRPDRPGAEYRLSTGLQGGTDYQLMRVRHGHVVGRPLTCDHRVRLGFPGDRLAFGAARTCLGSPERVRIGVKMRDEWDGSHPVVDWLGSPRSFTDWITGS